MIVMKFGGTSVKDAGAVDRVAKIIEGRLDRRPVVVVSAFGGTTDALASILDMLDKGSADGTRNRAEDIRRLHTGVIDSVIPGGPHRGQALEALAGHMERLLRLIEGMEYLGEVSPRSRDAVLSLGELIASPLLASFLLSRGLPAQAVDPRRVVVTDTAHERAVPELDGCAGQCRTVMGPLIDAGRIPVVGGYVGSTRQGVTTTLGRGGSDLTASIVARAFGAEALEFWKDVDGILTADPQVVAEARPVARLSFTEAAELAFLGARVLHPASIQPAVEAGVPVRVLNSYSPGSPGTLITSEPRAGRERAGGPEGAVVSIACKRDQILVNVYSTRMLGASGFLRRVFEVFEKLQLSVDHIATSEVNVSVTLAPTGRAGELASRLGEVAQVDIRRGVGIVSVVGDRIADTPGVASSIFSVVADMNIRLITYGGSGVNLSFVVSDDQAPEAVRRLHRVLFEDRQDHRGDGA